MKESRWACITGSSQGIGRAIAAECARRGLDLALVALPDTGLPQVADELARLYDVDVRFWEIDLCDHDAVERLVGEITGDGLEIELLVNNAGIGGTAPFSLQDADIIRSMLHLNVVALTLLTNMMLPLLQRQSGAHILNVASLAGCYPIPGMSVYSASKAYVLSLSLALRQELANTNVSVSVLCPSGVVTKEEVVKALTKQGFWGWATSRYPDQLARQTMPKVFRNRAVIVPGVINNLLRIAGKLAPTTLVTRIAAGRFQEAPPRRHMRIARPASEPQRHLEPAPAPVT